MAGMDKLSLLALKYFSFTLYLRRIYYVYLYDVETTWPTKRKSAQAKVSPSAVKEGVHWSARGRSKDLQTVS